MRQALQTFKKLEAGPSQVVGEVAEVTHHVSSLSTTQSKRLFIKSNDGHNNLIDTGSELSVQPPTPLEKSNGRALNNITLYAANNTRISTYGCKLVHIPL